MIWILHTGGLGDLVLAGELVAALKQSASRPTVTLAARRAVAPVAALYPIPPDAIVPLDVPADAALSITPDLVARMREQLDALSRTAAAAEPVEQVIAADFHPGFALPVLAAALRLKPGNNAALVSQATWPKAFARELLSALQLDPVEFTETAVTGPHERDRYRALALHAGAAPQDAPKPTPWTRPASLAELQHQPYLACFPLGAPSNRPKRWPAERFREVAEQCCRERGWRLVLVGSKDERAELETAFAGTGAHLHLTDAHELESHAAVVANAAAYLGNSTGPYHLASAYGVPGVAVHSGDTWPNYGPWSAGSVGVVHPLGCFRCGHDCLFGRGVCTESIPAADVYAALANAIAAPHSPPSVVTLNTLPDDTHQMITAANTSYRAAQRDRAAQNESMVELHAQLSRAIATIEARHSVAAHLMQALTLLRERVSGKAPK